MSKADKAIARLKTKPKDFSWSELTGLLSKLGYELMKTGTTGGSRRKFVHTENKDIISLHEPHPQPILKAYQVKEILEHLKEKGLIK